MHGSKYRLLIGLLVLAAAVAGGLAWQAQRAAADRAATIARWGQQSRSMTARMQQVWSAPVHDIGEERRAVAGQLDVLQTEVTRSGEALAGPGQLALGLGRLAILDDGPASRHLLAAWQHGERGPAVARALATAWLRLYERLQDDDAPVLDGVDAGLAKAEALRWLRLADAGSLGPATLAYLQERSEEAARLATPALAPEAHSLWWQIQGLRARQAAGPWRQVALALAPTPLTADSDLENYRAQCRTWRQRLALPASAGHLAQELLAADAACRLAVRVDPEDDQALGGLCEVQLAQAQFDLDAGRTAPQLPEVTDKIRSSRRLVDARWQRLLGEALRLRGEALAAHGDEGGPVFVQALQTLDAALALQPNARQSQRLQVARADVLRARAEAAASAGEDPTTDGQAALQALDAARALVAQDRRASLAEVRTSLVLAAWTLRHRQDASQLLVRAQRLLDAAGEAVRMDRLAAMLQARVWLLAARVPGGGQPELAEQAGALAEAMAQDWPPAALLAVEVALFRAARGRATHAAEAPGLAELALAKARDLVRRQGAPAMAYVFLAQAEIGLALAAEPPRRQGIADARGHLRHALRLQPTLADAKAQLEGTADLPGAELPATAEAP